MRVRMNATMTLEPSRIRSFLWSFLIIYVLLVILLPSSGEDFSYMGGVAVMAALPALSMGLAAAFFFTPGRLAWDEERISIRSILPGSGEYRWQQLEAYSACSFWGWNAFLIKFEGKQSYQIYPFGFRRGDWKEF